MESDHEIIPVLNKIDLPAADPDRVKAQIEEVIGIDASDALEVSAKTGMGMEEVLEAIVKRLPHPTGNKEAPLKAMLIDSWYDNYLGVVILVRVVDGVMSRGQRIKMMSNGMVYSIDNIGIFTPKKVPMEFLSSGEVGYITASIKQVSDCKVGDTITDEKIHAKLHYQGLSQVSQ